MTHFLIFILVMVLVNIAATGMCMWIGAATANMAVGNLLSVLYILMVSVFGASGLKGVQGGGCTEGGVARAVRGPPGLFCRAAAVDYGGTDTRKPLGVSPISDRR